MFSSLNKPPAAQSVFGNPGATSLFGQSSATGLQQQPQQQQPQQPAVSVLGQSQAPTNPQLGSSLWQPGSQTTLQRSIPEQIQLVTEKWDFSNPNCAFKTYLYNKVDEATIPFRKPGPLDDPKEWEEALQHKPAPNYIPVLCAGFPSIVARLVLQRRAISEFNNILHAINIKLDEILSRHDLEHSVRALNARRRHAELSKRCLALASKVQVLRNRGYALSSDEDELRQKLQKIDKGLQDPALSARMEELWSRLIVLRGHADSLKDQINKPGFADGDGLGEEIEAKAKKILEDYEKQLQHLKKQVDEARKDFDEWDALHNPTSTPAGSA
ncbi:hypothetical protein OQA88_5069 [Cercophora sp. LCS_1]